MKQYNTFTLEILQHLGKMYLLYYSNLSIMITALRFPHIVQRGLSPLDGRGCVFSWYFSLGRTGSAETSCIQFIFAETYFQSMKYLSPQNIPKSNICNVFTSFRRFRLSRSVTKSQNNQYLKEKKSRVLVTFPGNVFS